MNHTFFKYLLNFYPPYWATGITIKRVSPDFREVIVQMRSAFYNRNYMGTHFGGSLYAMTDPFYMLMLIQILGKEYIVWDKAALIDFVKPGKGTVTAHFTIEDSVLMDIYEKTDSGQKYLCDLPIYVLDQDNDIVAKINKTLYIRKKT